MKVLVTAFLCYVVAIEGRVLEFDTNDNDSLEDIILEGDHTKFSALVVMKQNNKTITSYSESKEVENVLVAPYNVVQHDDDAADNSNQKLGSKEPQPASLLRKTKVWKGCSKQGAKVCKKACKAAVKHVCSYKDCGKKLKRAFKKECKKSCKSYFLGD